MMPGGMVTAPQPEAVEAGLDALRAGGNAVDAAVATALVQTAVDPQMCGIAGFGAMHVYMPRRGVHTFIDFHGRAPLAARPDMWTHLLRGESEDGFGFILEGRVNEIGYGSITTPMTLKALAEALRTYGTRRLETLLEPAIAYCEDGFMVRPHVSAFWNMVATEGRAAHLELLTTIPATRRIYLKPDGTLRGVGEILKNSDMATTYRRIASAGVDDFYVSSRRRSRTTWRRTAGCSRSRTSALARPSAPIRCGAGIAVTGSRRTGRPVAGSC